MAHTLENIQSKVRLLTGRPSPQQITDASINDYINSYYMYDLPESMKLEKLKDVYSFPTEPGVDTYAFDRELYVSCDNPIYVGGYPVELYKDNAAFYNNWPMSNTIETVATGDGAIAGPYAGTISATPFLRSVIHYDGAGDPDGIGDKVNVLFSAETATGSTTAIDNGASTFLAPAVGNIDYNTGVFDVTFDTIIPAGNDIVAQVYQYEPS